MWVVTETIGDIQAIDISCFGREAGLRFRDTVRGPDWSFTSRGAS